MWSSDYPHNESTYGYSEKSLAAVVDAVGRPMRRGSSVEISRNSWGSNEVFNKAWAGGAMTTFAQTGTSSSLVIPETPDLGRLRREIGARLRSAMADRGVDAMVARQQRGGLRHRHQLRRSATPGCLTSSDRWLCGSRR